MVIFLPVTSQTVHNCKLDCLSYDSTKGSHNVTVERSEYNVTIKFRFGIYIQSVAGLCTSKHCSIRVCRGENSKSCFSHLLFNDIRAYNS